jgi:hypothetical protein
MYSWRENTLTHLGAAILKCFKMVTTFYNRIVLYTANVLKLPYKQMLKVFQNYAKK